MIGKEFSEISSADRGGGGKIESKASIVQVKGIPLQVVPDGEIPEAGKKDDVLEKLNQLELPENIQGVLRFNGVSSTQKCTPPFESGIMGVPKETHYTEVIMPIAKGAGIEIPTEPTYVYYKPTRTVVIGTGENGQGCAILSSAAATETSGSDYEVREIFIRKLLENTAASPSLWPILAYGRVGNEDFSRRFIVEPAYSNDQNLSSGSRVPQEQIEDHFLSILSQFDRFMSVLERPISLKPLGMKGSVYIIPRDVRGGNILYSDGQLYLRDFSQWRFRRITGNTEAIPVEIVAAHWATFNEFMASLKEFSRWHNLNPGGPYRQHAKFEMARLSPRMKKFARVWNPLLGALLDQSSSYGNVAEERLPEIKVEGKKYFVCSPPASLLRQILPKEFQGRE